MASKAPGLFAAQGFLAEGLQRTSAGLGSVIIDSQPLTVALLAALLFGERLRPAGVAGLGVGVLGLCLLEVPPEAISGTYHSGCAMSAVLWRALWMAPVAGSSHAVGPVLAVLVQILLAG